MNYILILKKLKLIYNHFSITNLIHQVQLFDVYLIKSIKNCRKGKYGYLRTKYTKNT